MFQQQEIPRDQALQNDEDDDEIMVTCVIPPRLNRSNSQRLPQPVSKHKARNNETQNESFQMPREQKLDLHLNQDDDKNDYYKRQTKSQSLVKNDKYHQDSLRQQPYPSYGNETQSNQCSSSAQFNYVYSFNSLLEDQESRTYNDEKMEKDNDQDDSNNYEIQRTNQNYSEVTNSKSKRAFREHHQSHFEPSASNNFVTPSSNEKVQSNRHLQDHHQNHFEIGAERLDSTQHCENSSFIGNPADMIQRQHFNDQTSSVAQKRKQSSLNNNYEAQNQQKGSFSSTLTCHNLLLQNERSFSHSTPKPSEPFIHCCTEVESLTTRIKELESERDGWKKRSKEFEEKFHEANAKLSDVKRQFDSYKAQARNDYNAALEDIDYYRDKSCKYNEQQDKLKYDLEKQEKNHKSAICKLNDQIEKFKQKANKVTDDKSTETDSLSIEPLAKSTVHKSIQTHSEVNVEQALQNDNHLRINEREVVLMNDQAEAIQNMSGLAQNQAAVVEENNLENLLTTANQIFSSREVKPEVIDLEEAFSKFPSTTGNSTTNERCPCLASGITRAEFYEFIQAMKTLKEKNLLNGDKKNRRSGLSQPVNAQVTSSTQFKSKRSNFTSTAQKQKRSQKDYYAICKRPKL